MSTYDRTGIQAVIGQKLDGQLQRLLSEYERPIQKKLFDLRRKCVEAEKLSPNLVGKSDIPIHQSDDLEYVYSGAAQDLADKAETHNLTRKSLQAAQLRHGYACNKQPSAVQAILVLLIAICCEALNFAAFISNAHMAAGPAAALTTSFLISLTNVSVCACAGFFIGRYRNYGLNALDDEDHYFRNTRIKAKALFIGFIALMVFFHLTVGLIRTQESIEAVHHSLPNYIDMLSTPEAIFIVILGACFSTIAFHKGVHSIDCPYPEIGRLQRAEEAAKQEVQDTFEFYLGEISAYFEDAEKALHKPFEDNKKTAEQYNEAVSTCHEARRHLEQTVRDGETQCRGRLAELITSYGAISGNESDVPMDTLKQMACFEKYLDVEIPAFISTPDSGSSKSDLLIEKNRAIKRLSVIFENSINTNGEKL